MRRVEEANRIMVSTRPEGQAACVFEATRSPAWCISGTTLQPLEVPNEVVEVHLDAVTACLLEAIEPINDLLRRADDCYARFVPKADILQVECYGTDEAN